MTNTKLLEIALLRNDVSKKELAAILGISLQALYNKIKNKAEFKASEISQIAKTLKLSRREKESIFFARCVD